MAQTLVRPIFEEGPRRFTIAEYDLIPDDAVGGDRVELIDGQIYTKMGQGFAHIAAGRRVMRALRAAYGEAFDVSSQFPIGLGDASKPEPDVLVLRGNLEDYDGRYPDPAAEIALLVEVSDSTLERDMDIKAELYARHGVPEYWVVNLRDRTLEVRRRPLAEGVYAETLLFPEGESVGVGSGRITVAEILPKA